MEKRTKKMILSILMIMSVLAADFLMLGSGIKTFASELGNKTNNENVEFAAYFKEGENRLDSLQKSIKAEDVKLFVEIKVKKEGYIKEGTLIEIENSNFNLKSEILSSNKYINKIEGNKVHLKQITAGETVEVELGIEPIISNKITTDFLSKISTVKMIGSYVYSKDEEGQNIITERYVSVNYQPDETTEVELTSDIITNKILAVNGENKRVVQLLIKSRLTNNEYPVKETTLTATIPQLTNGIPQFSVMAKDKLATNGTTEISSMDIENGIIEILLKNEPNENNEINWVQDAYDEVIVTYIFPEVGGDIEITTTSQIKVYNSEKVYTATPVKEAETKELNNVVIGKTEIQTEEMYKGKIYANIDKQYETKTSVVITKTKVVDEIRLQEGPDVLGTAESELALNTKYVTTKINIQKMLDILGQDGNIEIKNGETTTLINKETIVDENGDVVINHENSTSQLQITTSIPEKEGIIEINHTKVITGNTYTREQLGQMKTLKAKGKITGTITVNKEEQKLVESTTETRNSTLELKETTTKAEMTIDKTTLSATEANEVTVGIKLITDGEKYDLYKNPSILLKLPEPVENVEFIEEPSKLYADEFGVIRKSYDKTNKIITISMNGEQTAYPESSLTQAFIQLKLKITLKQFALSQTGKITMEYKNETITGSEEQEIQISSPSELIKMFNLSSNENTSLTEKVLQRVKEANAGKEFQFNIELLNNKDTTINNVKILGKLPTTGNTITGEDENTLQTTLKGIVAQNATIYYTENTKATEDIENATNGWTQNLSPNAKLYLIKLDSLARGNKYTANVAVQMPNPIIESGLSYTEYEVIYDTDTETEVRENSRKIGFVTSAAASIKVETTAQVGQDILKNGDTVKEGEVIKYTVTVKNNGTETLQNVKLELDVPEGAVYVKKLVTKVTQDENGNVFVGDVYYDEYYKEITDDKELAELTEFIIPELSPTTPYTVEYEVRVNKGYAEREIINKPIVIYDETTVKCDEHKSRVEEANIRVAIKRTLDASIEIYPNTESSYAIYVENLSNSKLKNLELEIISEGFIILNEKDKTEASEKIKIDEIAPKDEICIEIYGIVESDIDEMNISAIVKDSQGKKYRSNLVSAKVPRLGGTISMTSPQDGKYIQEGDLVEYNIIVKNTGDIENILSIKDKIPTYLQAQSIYVNKKLVLSREDNTLNSNYINYALNLKSQEQAQVDIIAKVGYIEEVYHGDAITNAATLEGVSVKENSKVITHILRSKSNQNEGVENIISGYAWLDRNLNGQRDSQDKILSGITVKLYNTLGNHYLSDENGNILEIVTDENGEYSFKKIENGSYLIVFEYDEEQYELTTSFAEGVDTSLNSKGILKQINIDETQIKVAAIEINNLNQNVFDMNIGLKEKTNKTPEDNEPDQPDIPQEQNTISGKAWIDKNRNGQKDEKEPFIPGVKVKIYDITTKNYLKGDNGSIIETTTDNNGKYTFNNIEDGEYILIFEYDTEKYEPTVYMVEGVDTTLNSKVVLNKININGKEEVLAVTDSIKVEDNISNINIGLKERLTFDLELNKYISRVVVQNSKGTKTYDYEDKTFAKAEIHRKQIDGSLVVLEYTIKVKNNGEMSGYVKNIIDYLPNGLTFSSELNKDWYLLGNNLHTKSFENVEVRPGEEKDIKLILTKTMTSENVGLINNRAEIYQHYNEYGDSDIDSTPNNQAQNEDDFGTTDVIIQIATGGIKIAYTILVLINMVMIGMAIKIMIQMGIIKIPTKKGRR